MAGGADFVLGISSGMIRIDLGEQPIISQHSVFWKETPLSRLNAMRGPCCSHSVREDATLSVSDSLNTYFTAEHALKHSTSNHISLSPFKEI